MISVSGWLTTLGGRLIDRSCSDNESRRNVKGLRSGTCFKVVESLKLLFIKVVVSRTESFMSIVSGSDQLFSSGPT